MHAYLVLVSCFMELTNHLTLLFGYYALYKSGEEEIMQTDPDGDTNVTKEKFFGQFRREGCVEPSNRTRRER